MTTNSSSEERLLIAEGDRVNVYFEYTSPVRNALVHGLPVAEGDSWKLSLDPAVPGDKRRVVYVQHFSKMERK
jgi:hypothetical protein